MGLGWDGGRGLFGRPDSVGADLSNSSAGVAETLGEIEFLESFGVVEVLGPRVAVIGLAHVVRELGYDLLFLGFFAAEPWGRLRDALSLVFFVLLIALIWI